MPRLPLPGDLPAASRVADARGAGISRSRLRGADLQRPFHGIRVRAGEPEDPDAGADDARRERIRRAAQAAIPLLSSDQFLSHQTAAVLWGAPVPLADERIHVTVWEDGSLPRTAGICGHRVRRDLATVRRREGLPVTSPASTWAMLGALPVRDLVVLGDVLCRVWRDGVGRPPPGRAPLATPAQLASALGAGRRLGAPRLREALARIRTDSWSPRESLVRCALGDAGLPEPALNVDIWTGEGRFLGCVDLCYPEAKIAIEYQGRHHAARYARDVERLERMRAAGWIVIEVTAELLARPHELVRRVSRALRSRGLPA
ncbi:endonuclease domain-containing protein [Microbacterium sp. gxy059]|uniref:endonuclease domain-containing protein n=1 Tax=Microbacterium sp. gxy059 TaxID=2957199 RepID=UPI003D976080